MLKALQLIFTPGVAWPKIAAAQRNVVVVFLLNPLPLMLLGSAAEAYGLMKLGLLGGEVQRLKPVPLSQDIVVRFAEIKLIGDMILLLLGSKLIQWIADGFHHRVTFTGGFTLMAYSMGPMFLFRALDGIPQLNTWLCWTGGVVLAVHLLYHGVALLLQPDQTKGFGLFLVTALMLVMLSALAHFVELSILKTRLLAPPSETVSLLQSLAMAAG